MYRVLVGSISPESEQILSAYLEKFMPGTEIEPLKAVGIKGRMKNHAKRQDVLLVILDEMLWDACSGVVDDVLALSKVHKYESDEGLREFLTTKFGPLEETSDTGTIPPDMLMSQQTGEEDDYVPKSADFSKDSSSATPPPDSFVAPIMVEEELPTTDEAEDIVPTDTQSEVVEKLEGQVRDLRSQLAGKETLIRSLTQQLDDKKASDQDDMSAMVGRIRELENELAEKDRQLSSSADDNFVNLGKVARAEQVLGEFDDLKRQIKQAAVDHDTITKERDGLVKKLESLTAEADRLRTQVAEIAGLRKDISDRETKIKSLEQQISDTNDIISDLKSEKADLEAASADAAEVATKLAQLESEAAVMQQQLDADKERLARLDDAEEELSAKQLEIDNLNADIRALNEKLDTQRSDIEQLREDLKQKTIELSEVQSSLEECREELRTRTAELEDVKKARDDALAEVSSSAEFQKSLAESTQGLGVRISDLTLELGEKTTQLESIMGKLTEAESSVESLTNQLEALQSDYDSKIEECDNLSQQLLDTQNELSDRTAECNGLSKQLEDLKRSQSANASEVQTQLSEKDEEISDLRSKLTVKDGTVTKLTSDITSLHEQLAAANGEVTQTREQLNALRQQLLSAQSAGNEAQISADTQKQALEKLLSEKSDLEDKLVAAESKRLELESRIKGLEEDLSQERSFRGSVDEVNVELTAQNEKLSNTIKQLEDSLVKAKADDEMVSRLESDLLEERRRSARLQSEVDVMKRTSSTDKASDLRIELVRVKKELADLQSTTAPLAEVERARSELSEARSRNAQLELALVEKDNQISAVSSSVFAQLQNIAVPKSVYDFRHGGVAPQSDKFVCVVSGSEESTANVYQLLRSACATDPQRKVLIIDLVTDSSIDRELGVKKIVSPIDWLAGKGPFNLYMAATRFGNVKVMSTALAYINDLFLLMVDWESRFAELEAFSADKVVLYVGCLNNLVTKILFDMFSKAMKTFVIVKATPINLRTTILNLTGFVDLSPTVTVECMNFSDTSSTAMYQRLVAKYKAQILRDNEALPL